MAKYGQTRGQELKRPDPKVIRRFMAKVELKTFGKDKGCWVWMGARRKDETPYGKFWIKASGGGVHAHRVSFAIFNNDGVLPDGMDVDHTCLNHWCVNPDHLQAVSREENVGRGNATRHNGKDEVPF